MESNEMKNELYTIRAALRKFLHCRYATFAGQAKRYKVLSILLHHNVLSSKVCILVPQSENCGADLVGSSVLTSFNSGGNAPNLETCVWTIIVSLCGFEWYSAFSRNSACFSPLPPPPFINATTTTTKRLKF